MKTFGEMKIGEYGYFYHHTIMESVEYKKTSETTATDKNGSSIRGSKKLTLFDTAEDAEIAFWSEMRISHELMIDKFQKNIDKEKQTLKKIDEHLSHYKIKYPEKFV